MNDLTPTKSTIRRKIARTMIRLINWRVKANRTRIQRRLIALKRWRQAQVHNDEMVAAAKALGHDMSWVEDLLGAESSARPAADSH